MAIEHPEWLGYLAAFDVYLDALARDDTEHQEQAKLIMGYFADGLLGELGAERRHRNQGGVLESLTELLGL